MSGNGHIVCVCVCVFFFCFMCVYYCVVLCCVVLCCTVHKTGQMLQLWATYGRLLSPMTVTWGKQFLCQSSSDDHEKLYS
jgi:hypothetical protein